jgi:hypothetical protein
LYGGAVVGDVTGGLVVGLVVGGFVVGGFVVGGRCAGCDGPAAGSAGSSLVGTPAASSPDRAAGHPDDGLEVASPAPRAAVVDGSTGAAADAGAKPNGVTPCGEFGSADVAAADSVRNDGESVVAANAAIPLTRVAVTAIEAANADRLGTVIPPRRRT